MAEGTVLGGKRSPLDTIIATIAETNDCLVVTNNERDFEAARTINPLRVR